MAKVRYLWSEEARRFRPAGVDHVSGQEAYKARAGWEARSELGFPFWRGSQLKLPVPVHQMVKG